MDVVGEAVEGVGGFVDMRAVVGALAGLDHHDVLVEGLAVLAAELDADGSGDVRAAAAAVHAGAAVLGPVLLQAGAAGVGELQWLTGLLGSAALLSFLRGTQTKMAIEIDSRVTPALTPPRQRWREASSPSGWSRETGCTAALRRVASP